MTPFVKYVILPLPMTPDIMFLAQQYFKGHAILKEQEIWIINVREDIVHNIMLEMNKRMPYTILTVTKTVWPQGVELWHRQYIQGKSVERHAVRIY